MRRVEKAIAASGNPGLSRHNPLQRHYRDVLCGRIHTPQADMVLTGAGKAFCAGGDMGEMDQASNSRPLPDRNKLRRMLHEVERVEGPERIATEWGRDDRGNKLTRDYFRVEDSEGRRYWIYREDETKPPRWRLHGLFA